MKISAQTTQILKNFSSINPSIMFKAGNTIRTVSPTKTMLAKAIIQENIPASFCVYDLSRFLGPLSLFDEPELEVGKEQAKITNGRQSVNYTFASPDMIVQPPEKDIDIKSAEIEFTLEPAHLQSLMRALGVLQLPEIAIAGDGEDILLQGVDSKNSTNDTFEIKVGETDKKFRMIFKSENMKLMQQQYSVRISSKGIGHFKADNIEYWIATEANSKYEG